jgi:hypothetical protein
MIVLRTTRRFRGAITVIAVLAIIFLVGPPAPSSNSAASDGTHVRFAASVATTELAPLPRRAATYRYHELQHGVWGVGDTTGRLPLLQVVRARTDSAAPANVVLDAAVRDRAASLRALTGAPVVIARRTVFGGYPGAMVTASDGKLMRTQFLATRGRALFVATVLHAPGDAADATELLDALRFAS